MTVDTNCGCLKREIKKFESPFMASCAHIMGMIKCCLRNTQPWTKYKGLLDMFYILRSKSLLSNAVSLFINLVCSFLEPKWALAMIAILMLTSTVVKVFFLGETLDKHVRSVWFLSVTNSVCVLPIRNYRRDYSRQVKWSSAVQTIYVQCIIIIRCQKTIFQMYIF